MIHMNCLQCDKLFSYRQIEKGRRKFCSVVCADNSRKGKPLSPETIKKMKATVRKKNLANPKPINKCPVCAKAIKKSSEYCQQHKQFTQGYKAGRISQSKTMRGKMPMNINRAGVYGNIVRGYYDINGKSIFLRSKWEANYALYLDFLIREKQIQKWEYETDRFIFEKIISGTRTYRPDFKVFNNDGTFEYHEVKGRMDSKSATKLKRMKKYYPDIKMVLIDQEAYRSLKKSLTSVMTF